MRTLAFALCFAIVPLAMGCDSQPLSLKSISSSPDASARDSHSDAKPRLKPKSGPQDPHFRGKLSFGCAPDDAPALLLGLYAFGQPCSASDDHKVAYSFLIPFFKEPIVDPPQTFQIGGEGLKMSLAFDCLGATAPCARLKSSTVVFDTFDAKEGASGRVSVELKSGEKKSATFDAAWCPNPQRFVCG